MSLKVHLGQETANACVLGEVEVFQQPFAVAQVSQNATLNCSFDTGEVTMGRQILYWYTVNASTMEETHLHPQPEGPFKAKVKLGSMGSPRDKSIELLNVQMGDSGVYFCLMSYMNGQVPERKKGNGTKLTVHGPLIFGPLSENSTALQCQVDIGDPDGFRLLLKRDSGADLEGNSVSRNDDGSFKVATALDADPSDRHTYRCALMHERLGVVLQQAFSTGPGGLPVPPHPIILYVFFLLFPFLTLLAIILIFMVKYKDIKKQKPSSRR
ncbi:uncharacterized protein LOC120540153 isoform X2 [Polypterus senegalus]|uniref:uncharacterized protein LOC120540153 isoform X2 n=1 Tax=Polypterus senegalus TaxID=55291 RepID=UPI0019634986|nr:uncharacterized protein LOC120540153 isoform X2 [Polypterus senegalus]